MKMEPTLKPEEVLSTVMNTKPVIAEVHQLHASLDDTYLLVEYDGIDNIEDIGVDIILGIKNGDHLVCGLSQANIQSMRLIHRALREGCDADLIGARMEIANGLFCHGDGFSVVKMADNDNL
jgi:hypothetical protein